MAESHIPRIEDFLLIDLFSARYIIPRHRSEAYRLQVCSLLKWLLELGNPRISEF